MPIDPTAARFGRCDEAQYTAPEPCPRCDGSGRMLARAADCMWACIACGGTGRLRRAPAPGRTLHFSELDVLAPCCRPGGACDAGGCPAWDVAAARPKPASADFDRLRTDLSALVAAVTSLWITDDLASAAACDDVDEAVRWLALAAGLGVLDADGPVLARLDAARTVATARAMLRELTPALAARVADPWRGAVLHAGLAVAERALDALGCQAARRAEAGREHGPNVAVDGTQGEVRR